MLVLRPTLSLRPAIGLRGRTPIGYKRSFGVSGVLEDAEAAARAAGINLECRTEQVGAGPGVAYTQNICAIPGHSEGFSADLIARPGGINILATELQSTVPATRPVSDTYFSTYGSAANVKTLAEGGGATTFTPPPAPASSPAAASTPAVSYSAKVVNLSRPGQPFQVGDRYRVEVRGAPNKTVTGSANHNGQSTGAQNFGATDSSGYFQLEGQLGAQHAGQWNESWTVGDTLAGTVSFSVAAAAGASSSSSSETTGGSEKQTTAGDDEGGIPTWAWIAGAAALGLFALRGARG